MLQIRGWGLVPKGSRVDWEDIVTSIWGSSIAVEFGRLRDGRKLTQKRAGAIFRFMLGWSKVYDLGSR